MAVIDLAELDAALRPGDRLLGVDLGQKTIGLALSDTERKVASPLTSVKRGKFEATAKTIAGLAKEYGARGVVVGLPLNMDGSVGPAAQSARAFAHNFAQYTGHPIALADERLSTAAVTRTLLEADTSRRRRAEVVDKLAAAYILQGAMDRINHAQKSGRLDSSA